MTYLVDRNYWHILLELQIWTDFPLGCVTMCHHLCHKCVTSVSSLLSSPVSPCVITSVSSVMSSPAFNIINIVFTSLLHQSLHKQHTSRFYWLQWEALLCNSTIISVHVLNSLYTFVIDDSNIKYELFSVFTDHHNYW